MREDSDGGVSIAIILLFYCFLRVNAYEHPRAVKISKPLPNGASILFVVP